MALRFATMMLRQTMSFGRSW